ncbi:hypothetical protein R8Z50_23020 [Longispora sp. K20-0274]|uniref:hypothetical protein n=1 Tax=Longispora sp. K20-0274 TaxID=3088255 RepID=UPI00399961E7
MLDVQALSRKDASVNGPESPSRRFVDQGRPLTMYSDLIYVACPNCGARAQITPRPGLPELRYYSELLYRPRRLTCTACAATRSWSAKQRNNALVGVKLGGPSDPFFDLPLWLQTPCRGEVLWAYNERHLDILENYVAADLRERTDYRSNGAMLSRLPAWMKAAGHRADVLRAIRRLRIQLEQVASHDRSATMLDRTNRGPRGGNNYYFRPPY